MNELFEKMIYRALNQNATDIHLLLKKDLKIQFRIFGELKKYEVMENERGYKLMNFIKYRSMIHTNYRLMPQTGNISINMNQKTYFLRVSYLPSLEFESIVIRILNNHELRSIEELTYQKEIQDYLYWLSLQNSGLFFISGATGSGKSTTLYTLLKQILSGERKNIITIEDPIEIHLDGCLQIELNEKIGITYHDTLKQILRHDPDVIMIGEIRDEKTAKIALTCALTGHLVLTTIHASNAPLSMKRLMNLGIHEADILDVVIGVISQRMKYDIQNKQVIVLSELMKKKDIEQYLKEHTCSYLSFQKAALELVNLGFDQALFKEELNNE